MIDFTPFLALCIHLFPRPQNNRSHASIEPSSQFLCFRLARDSAGRKGTIPARNGVSGSRRGQSGASPPLFRDGGALLQRERRVGVEGDGQVRIHRPLKSLLSTARLIMASQGPVDPNLGLLSIFSPSAHSYKLMHERLYIENAHPPSCEVKWVGMRL